MSNAYASLSESQALSATYVDMLMDPATVKEAVALGEGYTRTRLREESFMDKVITPKEISDSEIDPRPDSDQPWKIFDLETDVPMACSVGFGDLPHGFYFYPKKYTVTSTMIQSPRIMKLDQELRTYRYDVKQVLADNIVKDLGYEKDRNFITAINEMLLGQNTNMPVTGIPQWISLRGGWTRENVVEGLTQMQKIPNALMPELCLANTVTLMQFEKWRRDEAGGDISEKMYQKGYVEKEAFGVKWFGTIKRYLVGDYTFYQFAPTKFIGHHIVFQPPTMWVDNKYHRLAFHCDMQLGCTIGNIFGSIVRVDVTN